MHVLKKGVAEEAEPVTSVAVRAASDETRNRNLLSLATERE